jgi:hypothetical protein
MEAEGLLQTLEAGPQLSQSFQATIHIVNRRGFHAGEADRGVFECDFCLVGRIVEFGEQCSDGIGPRPFGLFPRPGLG